MRCQLPVRLVGEPVVLGTVCPASPLPLPTAEGGQGSVTVSFRVGVGELCSKYFMISSPGFPILALNLSISATDLIFLEASCVTASIDWPEKFEYAFNELHGVLTAGNKWIV